MLGEGFCALLNDGTVACWGANGGGQLGRGDEPVADSATPARVVGLSDVVSLDHTCARRQERRASGAGARALIFATTGRPQREFTPVKLPIPPAKTVGVGSDVACAVVDDGVLCWGQNTSGQVASFDSTPHAVLPPRAVDSLPARRFASSSWARHLLPSVKTAPW